MIRFSSRSCQFKFRIAGIFILFVCLDATMVSAQQKTADTLSVYFNFNSSALKSSESNRLQTFLKSFNIESIDSLTIYGFADTTGKRLYNEVLAGKRANYVSMIIKRLEGDSTPINKIVGGETLVFGNNSLNRKAEIIVHHQQVPAAQKLDITDELSLVDTVIRIPNLYFIEDSPILTAESRQSLPSFVRSLSRFKEYSMQVKGHVNFPYAPLTEKDDLFRLSQQRAKTILDFLVSQGFSAERLSYIGLGNSEMLYPEPRSLDEQRSNMRVEIVVFRK